MSVSGVRHSRHAIALGVASAVLALAAPASARAVAGPDQTPPTAQALPSASGTQKPVVTTWEAWDDSGDVQVVDSVQLDGRTVATERTAFRHTSRGADYRSTFEASPWWGLAGTLRHCVQALDRAGHRSRISCAPLKVTDTTPPAAQAVAVKGPVGATLRLLFRVSDNSGEVQVLDVIRKGSYVVARVQTRFARVTGGTLYSTPWKPPASLSGSYAHCVQALDRAGNRSRPVCAPLRLLGPPDLCPDVASGPYDYNDNGCPGPFELIEPDFGTAGSLTSENRTELKLVLSGLPAGTRATIQVGKDAERLEAGASGAVASKLLGDHFFDAGTIFTLELSKAGWIGYIAHLKLTTRSPGYVLQDRLCVPATGDQTPRPCASVDRGK